MTFTEALKVLGIEDYAERIWKCNSHGELFHIEQYIQLVEEVLYDVEDKSWFRPWFESVLKKLNNDQLVFQKMLEILKYQLQSTKS